ncbi:hypothetical protein LCGC14_0145630 [marine sediment metagenome]|uniref:Uncharacterized protein n=1 Tax=marine sediment metagenome TaxID=412755 RepID=A0A0F9Y1B5_9ZZZZ
MSKVSEELKGLIHQSLNISRTLYPEYELDLRDILNRIYDEEGVKDLGKAMIEKLAEKRDEGRGGWFMEDCEISDLKEMLVKHLDSGDMVDVANFVMMIWNKEQDKT